MLLDTLLQDAVEPLGGAAASALVWRAGGRLQVTMLAKATFAFAQGTEMQLASPQAILRDEVHHGRNPARSVRFTSDLVPYLGRADVLFTGHAHAPAGAPQQLTQVRLGIFGGNKALL